MATSSETFKTYGHMVPRSKIKKIVQVLQQLVECRSGDEDWPATEKLLDELEDTYGTFR